MRFGIHVGIGGGFAKTIAEALADGCECIQIFAGNPRGWRTTPYDPAAWANFAKERKAHDIAPTVIHTSYLINLAAAESSCGRRAQVSSLTTSTSRRAARSSTSTRIWGATARNPGKRASTTSARCSPRS